MNYPNMFQKENVIDSGKSTPNNDPNSMNWPNVQNVSFYKNLAKEMLSDLPFDNQ